MYYVLPKLATYGTPKLSFSQLNINKSVREDREIDFGEISQLKKSRTSRNRNDSD